MPKGFAAVILFSDRSKPIFLTCRYSANCNQSF
jgi:hypothetical protein